MEDKGMVSKAKAEWQLDSGSWSFSDGVPGLRLERTALGQPASAKVGSLDVARWMAVRQSPVDPGRLFPPEFKFSPATGEALQPAGPPPDAAVWVPPFGGAPQRDSHTACGLRQTSRELSLVVVDEGGAAERRPSLPLPPPGNYHFFSASFGTLCPALLALDLRHGALFAWLSGREKWEQLQSDLGPLLPERASNRSYWRAEFASCLNNKIYSKIYLPTSDGLACLIPDVPALQCQYKLFGTGAALGGPIWFDGKIWIPLRALAGTIHFFNLDAEDREGSPLPLECEIELGQVGEPVCYGREAVWPCENGQIFLRKQSDGTVGAFFSAWPKGTVSKFDFGSPYLARDGGLWQLCFDEIQGCYVYFQLGRSSESRSAPAPRFCSGQVNYQHKTKSRDEPWQEQDREHEPASNEFDIPLLESTTSDAVVGLRLTSSSGLEDMLASRPLMDVDLVLDGKSGAPVFHTFRATEPWKLRLFAHEGRLWAYHTGFSRIEGWDLQP